ncbi:methylisocitrate lyase [Silicimonas algicola]|uniref:Methylisocitrate lyase n=1 Tax=Silicimonas algicola TaxID=1826607 RepID=A0A316G1N6_9RHOB|nr:isocitrate lyase/phosphoenolpyruvate mutase family protein [Silicimonas algicola]AZQ68272.1 methylisocitrate lyase [Silicimonas algicola]PWK54592.1 methylisocitrate lyase [Silicimonas algicola]
MTDWLLNRDARPHAPPTLQALIDGGGTTAVAGCWDGLSALLAKRAGFQALYLSGAALSASMALPDLGLLTMEDVTRAARTVVRASGLPLIVDGDTGFGEALNVMRAVRELESAGAAAIQIEDQDFPKKCGHLNDKRLVPMDDMCRKVAAAKKAADSLLICARTDAVMISLDEALTRARAYVNAGADIVFVEAMTSADMVREVRGALDIPLLGNMTEFGRTPIIPLSDWTAWGVNLVIYPVSALRVAGRAMEEFYGRLIANGDVSADLSAMMTRAELYERIGYYDYERLDENIAATVLPDHPPADGARP